MAERRGTCDRPPAGWFCKLDRGHGGPCPAAPEGDMSDAAVEALAEALGWDWQGGDGVPSVNHVLSGVIADLTELGFAIVPIRQGVGADD